MITILPLIPSDPDYEVSTTLNDEQYTFVVRWNSRSEAWYFDMYDADGLPVVMGVKVVLGTYLGRQSAHPFFMKNVLVAVDTTLEERDPGYDDLGTRVLVVHYPASDLVMELLAL